jgi:hypothetical protein
MTIHYEVLDPDGHRACTEYKTVSEAAQWVSGGWFVAAVEDGVLRRLNPDEELEYQHTRGTNNAA